MPTLRREECAICTETVLVRELQHGCARGHHVCHACHAQWRPHDEACLICIPYVEGDGAISHRVEDAEEEEWRGDFPGCIRRILLPYLFPCNMLFVCLCAMVFKGVTYGVLAARQELPAPAWARFDDPRITLWLVEGMCTAFLLVVVEYAWYGR